MAELIERLQEEPRLRQRAAALAGVTLFFAAGLVVAGLGEVVLVVIGLAFVGRLLAVIATRLPLEDVQQLLRTAWSEHARPRLAAVGARTRGIAATAAARTQHSASPRTTHAAEGAPPPEDEFYGWPYAGSDQVVSAPRKPEPRIDEERRRALELNANGSNLRRAGSAAEAAGLHLEALEIFRALDDRRAEALTLNSLALALVADGQTDAAVERFEESLSILRERPEDPGEAEVIANLGFTLLQQGGEERARELLNEALENLPPDSQAAHKVEAQLRRAS